MFNFIKRHKFVFIVVLADLLLFWLLFYSGVVLPFINPSIEHYKELIAKGTSFPRNTNQMLLWILIHFPASYIISGIARNEAVLSLSVVQAGIIAYFLGKFIQRKKKAKIKY